MVNRVEQVKNNYETIIKRIEHAASSSGRKPEEVCLIVVSKLQPMDLVQDAIDAGICEFGENYPVEGAEKIESARTIQHNIRWHMIGHVQSRKAGIVAKYFDFLHSLDSLRLAQKLEKVLTVENKILPTLLEINVSGEESKQGLPAWDKNRWSALADEVAPILGLPHIQVCGLMTMPPQYSQAESSRPHFRKLYQLREYLTEKFPQCKWQHLSMGTTQDFEIAVQEGATFVRVGQAILGERPHKSPD